MRFVSNGKCVAYSRMGIVESVNKFYNVNDGCWYYHTRVRKFDSKNTVGIEVTFVTRKRLFRKGQYLKITAERR